MSTPRSTPMNKLSNIFNPYSLLFLGVFIEYFPTFYNSEKPALNIGPISLYITDFSILFLFAFALFNITKPQPRLSLKKNLVGKNIQIIFGLFFVYSIFKWFIQSEHDTGSIRMMLAFATAYIFLFFFPMHMGRQKILRNLLFLLVLFQVYIFILHIYAFSTQGFILHILSGGFLSMLSLLYFFLVIKNNLLKFSPTVTFFLKASIIITYFMVGHRSGLIALMLGLIALYFFSKKTVMKEVAALMPILILGIGMAFIISPNLLTKISERAATTFDTKQDTYQGRFYNVFKILELSKHHPIIGKPLVTNETVRTMKLKTGSGNSTTGVSQLVVTPHNLVLEWLLYYGWLGVLFGSLLIIISSQYIYRFLRTHKYNRQCYQIGVIVLCTMIHNLFYALTNVTTSSIFATFFLYFPIIMLIAISRNEKTYCK